MNEFSFSAENGVAKNGLDGVSSHGVSAVENVSIDIEAFIGSSKLPFGELRALKPDDIISLGTPLNELVELRVNGVAIATGELIAVGDQFAVRIVEVAK